MKRPDACPNCGASTTAHTGSYCQECGEPLAPERPLSPSEFRQVGPISPADLQRARQAIEGVEHDDR